MTERLTIAEGERLTVAEGSTLTVAGDVYNYGDITGSARIFCDHLYNFGTIDSADWLTGFTATATGPTAIELAWSTSRPESDTWTIDRKLQSEESWTTLDDVSGTSWTDTPPRANVKYDYRITNNTDADVTATDPAWLTTAAPGEGVEPETGWQVQSQAIKAWLVQTLAINVLTIKPFAFR